MQTIFNKIAFLTLILLQGCAVYGVQKGAESLPATKTARIYMTSEHPFPKPETDAALISCWPAEIRNLQGEIVFSSQSGNTRSVVLLPGSYTVKASCVDGVRWANPSNSFQAVAGHSYRIYAINDYNRAILQIQNLGAVQY